MNFTGIDANQDLSAEILAISENIPGSSFLYTSESQYIFVPKTGTYTFVYNGVGNGPTTVGIDTFRADVVTPVIGYSDIPTTANTNASFVVEAAAPEHTQIEVDANGDGDTDRIVVADGVALPLKELIALLKDKIEILNADKKVKEKLQKRVRQFEEKLAHKHKNILKELDDLKKELVKQFQKGEVTEADEQELLIVLEQIKSAL